MLFYDGDNIRHNKQKYSCAVRSAVLTFKMLKAMKDCCKLKFKLVKHKYYEYNKWKPYYKCGCWRANAPLLIYSQSTLKLRRMLCTFSITVVPPLLLRDKSQNSPLHNKSFFRSLNTPLMLSVFQPLNDSCSQTLKKAFNWYLNEGCLPSCNPSNIDTVSTP